MRVVWAVVAVMLVGCEPKEVRYAVRIVTKVCDPAKESPLMGVQVVQVRVLGEGIAKPVVAQTRVGSMSSTIDLPNIPTGPKRVIEVRGYESDPPSRVVSIGRSLPIDIPDVVPAELKGQPIPISVFLRRTDSLVPVSSVDTPTQCATLNTARAGHTATLLDDGRVFIAGGYGFDSPGLKTALADVEIYDPNVGLLRLPRTPRMETRSGGVFPKAFHTATKVKNGQVMVWGGETFLSSGVSVPSPVVIYFDPTNESKDATNYPLFRGKQSMVPRSQHTAAGDRSGKVLIAGGVTRGSSGSAAARELEWYDPDTDRINIVSMVSLQREQGVLVPFISKMDQAYVAMVGGLSGTDLAPDVLFFAFTQTTVGQQMQPTPPRLAMPGRRGAPATTLNGSDLLVVGGYADTTGAVVLRSTELVSNGTVIAGPDLDVARAESCVVAIDDSTVFGLGGLTRSTAGAPLTSDNGSFVIRPSMGGSATFTAKGNLPKGRHHHTCTRLSDGSVLIVGGANRTVTGSEEVLNDVWVYTPPVTD
jgi:hypothetical protein